MNSVIIRQAANILRQSNNPISSYYYSQFRKISSYKLTYFNIRALGEHIRFIFAAAGVPFEDVRLPREKWDELKSNYTYERLPILTVDGKEINQSLVIARFLAKKYDLVVQDPFLDARAEQVAEILNEVRLDFREFILERKDEARRAALKQNLADNLLPRYYTYMENLVQETSGSFITGDKPVWQDFFVANWLEIWEEFVKPGLINDFPGLKKLKEAVFAIPAIQAYVNARPKTM